MCKTHRRWSRVGSLIDKQIDSPLHVLSTKNMAFFSMHEKMVQDGQRSTSIKCVHFTFSKRTTKTQTHAHVHVHVHVHVPRERPEKCSQVRVTASRGQRAEGVLAARGKSSVATLARVVSGET